MESIASVVSGIRGRAAHSRRVYTLNVVLMLMLSLALVGLYLMRGIEISFHDEPHLGEFVLLLSILIVRVGAVALGIYAVQIMFRFARFHIRIAHHLDSSADAIELCGDDLANLATIQKALMPIGIDFDRPPNSPSDSMFELLREAIKRVPSPK